MDVAVQLENARKAFAQQAWSDAFDAFTAIDGVEPLGAADLELLSEASDNRGRGDDTIRVLQRAYRSHVESGEIGDAVRCAFWLWHALLFKGDFAQAGAWLARATHLAESSPECAQRGYLLIAEADRQHGEGDYAAALASAGRAAELGKGCGDQDLVALAAHIQGRARVYAGGIGEGLALLDEAMLPITAGETSTRVAGWIYCSTISTCHELHEVRRAREWTAALNAWCDASPQFTGGYAGVCRVHRSELLQLGGQWRDAAREAQVACGLLTQGYGEIAAGMAYYQLGEIARLRGRPAEAEESYRSASRYGWDTQPGMALLRLAQGKADAAAAGIHRALTETTDYLARSRLLPAFVEIMLAAGQPDPARAGAAELTEIAARYDTAALNAQTAHVQGSIQLADGHPEPALADLRRAWRLWHDLDAPYEAARTRVLIGLACRALADEDSAAMEWNAARQVFHQLGAAPDLARLDVLTHKRKVDDESGLSPREIEVLRLVAVGKTNHAIAEELFLSDKTVHRHVSNILTKLGVSSRTAAAAYAFEHGISSRAP